MRSSSSGTPFVSLLQTVFTSIVEVFLLCLAGYILAGRGILDKKTQKQLNRLNVSLFTPALLFSKVAFFLSPAKLRELWVIPIFFVIVTTVSMGIAFFLGVIFRLKRSQRSFAMAAAMFMNSNSLPIALMQSLVVTVPGLKWEDDDNNNAMVGRALTYLVLYSTLGMVLRWSYGVRLLSQADDPEPVEASDEVDEYSPLLAAYNDEDVHGRVAQTTASPDILGAPPAPTLPLRPPPRRRTTFYNSFPNSPDELRSHLPRVDSLPSSSAVSTMALSPSESEAESDNEDPQTDSTLPTHTPPPPHRRRSSQKSVGQSHSVLYRFCARSAHKISRRWAVLNDFMTVPLWAALASLVVACIQPIQHGLEVHVVFIKGALASAGECSIPLTLIVLGAYFYPPKDEEAGQLEPPVTTERNEEDGALTAAPSSATLVDSVRDLLHLKKPSRTHRRAGGRRRKARQGEVKTVAIAVLSRMILTPLLLMPLVAIAAKYDWHQVFTDPVFVVSNVLLMSSPPALTLAQITQAASGDAFERLISRTIFWSYCIVTPPATIFYVVVGLVLAKL